MAAPARTDLFCKDCRYWYGADTAEPLGARLALRRSRGARRLGLSAPYAPRGVLG